jgi:hypothetical protein
MPFNANTYFRDSNIIIKDRWLATDLLSDVNLFVTDQNTSFGAHVNYSIEEEYIPADPDTFDITDLNVCDPNTYKIICDELTKDHIELSMRVAKALEYNNCIANIIGQTNGPNPGSELARRQSRLEKIILKEMEIAVFKKYKTQGSTLTLTDVTDPEALYTDILKYDTDLDTINAPITWNGAVTVVPTGEGEFVDLNENVGNLPARKVRLTSKLFSKLLEGSRFVNCGSTQAGTNGIYQSGELYIGNCLVQRSMTIERDLGCDVVAYVCPYLLAMTKCMSEQANYMMNVVNKDKTAGVAEVIDMAFMQVNFGAKLFNQLGFVYHEAVVAPPVAPTLK